MTLVDTSVWIDHFRSGDPKLQALLEEGEVLIHPYVVGELACGNLRNRESVLGMLGRLAFALEATDMEVLYLIEREALYGRGLGWPDCHLLASARLTNCAFFTKDKVQASAAAALGVPCL
jgi:predicted nucleic acid-binding protein